MDLENRLLIELSAYDPHLETFARMRAALCICMDEQDEELRELADSLVETYLLRAIEKIIPDDDLLDDAILATCERRREVVEHLVRSGHLSLDVDDGLMNAICAWAAAQPFTSWGVVPWKRLAEVVLDGDTPEENDAGQRAAVQRDAERL